MQTTMYGFEYRAEAGWSADHCGSQGPDNYFSTRAAAEGEMPNLAECMATNGGMTAEDILPRLRVVAVEVAS